MRTITPVGDDERRIACGCYVYDRDGAPAGVTEPWTVHARPGGGWVTRVERDARAALGPAAASTLLVEAEGRGDWTGGAIDRFEVRLESDRGAAAGARYRFADGAVEVERMIAGAPAGTATVALPDGVVVSPLMRIFLGPVILQVAGSGPDAVTPVLTPFLEDPTNTAELFRPVIEDRAAALLGEETARIDGREVQTRCYRYLSGQYDDRARFWLDARGALVMYRFHQRDGGVWTVQLCAEHVNPA